MRTTYLRLLEGRTQENESTEIQAEIQEFKHHLRPVTRVKQNRWRVLRTIQNIPRYDSSTIAKRWNSFVLFIPAKYLILRMLLRLLRFEKSSWKLLFIIKIFKIYSQVWFFYNCEKMEFSNYVYKSKIYYIYIGLRWNIWKMIMKIMYYF